MPRPPARFLDQSATARRLAASDRNQARDDRHTGASARLKADLDRGLASADRAAGEVERSLAEHDRVRSHTDRCESAQERESAALDDLTGAYRRTAGIAQLQREIARAKRSKHPLALAFADVDNLKATNDVLGHAAGDQMLREIVNTIRTRLRPYDLIIRYGGDEFVCVISEIDLTEAAARFSLVNADLALHQDHGSVTVGLAELSPDDLPADLIARADADLYRVRDQKIQCNP
jgi:diguanylate cyclase (GGDEF)-like protein